MLMCLGSGTADLVDLLAADADRMAVTLPSSRLVAVNLDQDCVVHRFTEGGLRISIIGNLVSSKETRAPTRGS